MIRSVVMEKRFFTVMVILFGLLLVFGCYGTAFAEAGYMGSEVCGGCHSGIYEGFIKSIHGKKSLAESPANRQGCESCHGPGAAHAEKGGGRGKEIFAFNRKISARDRSSQCLACHGESKSVAFWDMSRHRSLEVSCDDCHSMHYGGEKYLKAGEPALCFQCHRDIRSQSNRQSRHPLKEGLMKCSDCHNPMGGFGKKQTKSDSVNELCYTCHAERRGPFLWEHPPVAEKCLNCHVPHGSNHSKLLRKKAPYLCQSCHDERGHPGAINTRCESFRGSAASGKNKMFARACLNCHSNIHGSNGPAARGSHWLR